MSTPAKLAPWSYEPTRERPRIYVLGEEVSELEEGSEEEKITEATSSETFSQSALPPYCIEVGSQEIYTSA